MSEKPFHIFHWHPTRCSGSKRSKETWFQRVEVEVAPENTASMKLAKGHGFVLEGKKRKGLLLDDGRYVDLYLFGKVFK